MKITLEIELDDTGQLYDVEGYDQFQAAVQTLLRLSDDPERFLMRLLVQHYHFENGHNVLLGDGTSMFPTHVSWYISVLRAMVEQTVRKFDELTRDKMREDKQSGISTETAKAILDKLGISEGKR